jgi:NADPH-dependent 2,4-dienoyl-CoA reductase/sulfur reductase-like enzyme
MWLGPVTMEADCSLPEKLQSRCCIAGGGPARMMLGLLLARAGIEVLVLEKHADFLRDFRGDTATVTRVPAGQGMVSSR